MLCFVLFIMVILSVFALSLPPPPPLSHRTQIWMQTHQGVDKVTNIDRYIHTETNAWT